MCVNISEVFEIGPSKKCIIFDNHKFSEFRLNKGEKKMFSCTK